MAANDWCLNVIVHQSEFALSSISDNNTMAIDVTIWLTLWWQSETGVVHDQIINIQLYFVSIFVCW